MDTYKAKAGDSLSKIAEQAGTTVGELLKANPDIKNPDLIYAGRVYNLPITSLYEYKNNAWVKNTEAGKNIDEDIEGKTIEKLGNNILLDFSDDNSPIVYLYNAENKSYTPMESIEAAANYYGVPISTIEQRINMVKSNVRNTPGMEGEIVPYKYRIKPDGTKIDQPKEDTVDITSLNNIYGKTKQDPSTEDSVGKVIGTLFTTAKLNGDISDETFQSTINNPTQLAKYVNATLYGGYNLGDIYRDVKAKELFNQGNSEYSDFKAFDENTTADTWRKTEDGQKVQTDVNLNIPATLNMDASLFNLPLFQIPGAAFSTLTEPIDFSSPEFQKEADDIQAAYYDIMTQKVEATSEQEKAIADNNWKVLREDLEKKYGFQLSDNAEGAWSQLQDIFKGSAQKGLSGSGITQELIDKQLQQTRKTDERLRAGKISTEEQQQRNYLLQYGSPEQINTFVGANPEKAKEWGLVPGDETSKFFGMENLRKLYPDKKDSELMQYRNLVVSDKGNVQSGLYQKLYGEKFDLAGSKKEYQQSKLYSQKLVEEEKAYRPYTSDSPFLQRDTPEVAPTTPPNIGSQAPTPSPTSVPDASAVTATQRNKALEFAKNLPKSTAPSPVVTPPPAPTKDLSEVTEEQKRKAREFAKRLP